MIWYRIPIKPVTKKNSQRIVRFGSRPSIRPSKQYERFEKDCGPWLVPTEPPIDYPINLKCVYYFHPNKDGSIPKILPDLANLLSATCDVLVKHQILSDDNCMIIRRHDGSEVVYSPTEDERTEVEITRL